MARWSYRGARPWVALGGVLLGCAALVTASSALGPTWESTATHRGGRDTAVRVLQMNLCDSGFAGCYTGRSVAEAGGVIRAEEPDVVTLNEVCRGDVAVLARSLADTGGAVVSAFQAAGDRRTGGDYHCRNGQPYGIGLVARLAPTARGSYGTAGGIYPVQDLGTPEERAWVCLRPTGAAATGAVAVCTTHLSNASPQVARDQCRYLLGTTIPALRAGGAPMPVVLGGDFNLRAGATVGVQTCVPADDRRADDGFVQHVVVTPEFAVGSRRMIDMHATDHPGLLVTLTLGGRRTTTVEAQGFPAATGPATIGPASIGPTTAG